MDIQVSNPIYKGQNMKIHPLAAAALALVSASASAQSSVTLFGIVDAAVTIGKGSLTDRTQLTSGAFNTSRIGFRGTEDLGGGMSASFWLEAGISADSGMGNATSTNNQASGTTAATAGTQGLAFNRRATVSLAGTWGEVRLGRDYNPQLWSLALFDPFYVGVGYSLALLNAYGANPIGAGGPYARAGGSSGLGVRSSNAIGYFLPGKLGGFYGQAQYYLGENAQNGAATEKDGTGYGVRVGYGAGPVNVALAYQNTNFAAGDVETVNLAASWDFGMVKPMALYNRDRVPGQNDTAWSLGATAPIGAGVVRAAYSQLTSEIAGAEPKARKIALGYVHNLSKRTAVYTTVARVRNSNGQRISLGGSTTGVNTSSTSFDLGLRHSF